MPVAQGEFTYRSGLRAAEELLSSDHPPSAIFASNDDMGAATVNVAHRRGLLVPRDLSVVGFDDTAPATTVWPELTTIRQPVSAIAAAALELLMAHIRAERTGQSLPETERVLDFELVVRRSSGPAPQGGRAPRRA
jgi:LacI family transcriptional regulator